ncbi:MAG TPA: cytochrome c-type biogenesis protein CcmH [Vicinamibacteria bacterium]|nr:cytochrome c-type biogenesis protein CcmH [Vicinamibacteria bacterium]
MKWLEAFAILALVSQAAVSQERYNSDEYREATESLMCQCGGCPATVATCSMEHCHSAEPIREEIAKRLQEGSSVASIIETFADRYGLAILAAPPVEGFHVTAWAAPFLVLAVGFFITRSVLRSWKRESATAGNASVGELSEAERARIERELRDIPS